MLSYNFSVQVRGILEHYMASTANAFILNLTVSLSHTPWWRHQMETISALLAICTGNSPVTGEFLAQRAVTRSFDVFFNLCLNKQLSKQLSKSWGWWFETPSWSLWRHCNAHAHILQTHYMYWLQNKWWRSNMDMWWVEFAWMNNLSQLYHEITMTQRLQDNGL